MASLSDLPIRMFARMNPDERFALIRETRTLRRQTVNRPTKRAPSAKKKTVAKSLDRQIENLSPDQLNRLMELLENAS